MDIKRLKKLIREIITDEYQQEYKADVRKNLNSCKTVEDIISQFKDECYQLSRYHSGIMDYQY